MKPIHFDNANTVIRGEGAEPLPALFEDGCAYTAWELDDEERQTIANGGFVLLGIDIGRLGYIQPVKLGVHPAEVT